MNKTLPVFQCKSEIVKAIKDNPVVVITAETGAGKSTQVPQYLLEEGYNLVVTQPRRLAARTVAQRVAEEYGCEFGDVVGFRTAYERCDSDQTRCLFVTDGLALVRELMGFGKHNVLVLDEVHEWNLNIEVLVSWAKRQIEAGVDFRVVIMSATLEADKLAAFYSGAPVINVPGRLFPVEEKQAGYNVTDDAAKLLKAGRNVLVFQPGKAEIADTVSQLKAIQDLSAEILPLHGELNPEEQVACFKHYGRPKCVVSTNVAQTSVTIDDIDAVIDSGMERRVELVDGVEGLYLKPISFADAKQRKGRAGRTKDGVYIDHCGSSNRLDFPKAEILRVRLDQTVLRLAEAGIDAQELEFFHQPDKAEIHEAKRALKALGCMDDKGLVTKIGHRVAKLPISVKFGRMVIEAENLGVVDDVIDIAALLEQGEITIRKTKDGRLGKYLWGNLCPNERESDVMAQLAIFRAAENMSKADMVENGVFVKAFYQAKEKRKRLASSLRGKIRNFDSTGKREDIIRSICAGMVDHLFRYNYGNYVNGDNQSRQLSEGSVVSSADWLVGLPFDLEIKTRRGRMTLRLVTMATKVDPKWLVEVAPQLVQIEEGLFPCYDAERDSCFSTTRTHFNGQMVREEKVGTPEHDDASEVFASWLAGQMVEGYISGITNPEKLTALGKVIGWNQNTQSLAKEINTRAGEVAFPVMSQSEWKIWLAARLNGARRAGEISNFEALRLPELDQEIVNMILAENPDAIEVLGRDVIVEYRPDYAPRVRMDFRGEESRNWLQLPDDGICLPSGREVAMYAVVEGYGYYIEANSSQFKGKVREYLNQGLWEKWQKPEIAIPDLVADGATIPEIITKEYGKCVVSEVSLVAYGTLTAYRYWSNDPITWKYEWYRDMKLAEENRNKAVAALAQFQSEERKKLALAVIVVPDPSQEGVVIPEIAEIEGGYGFIQVETSHYSGTKFLVQWHTDRDYADRKRAEAVAKLVEVRAEEVKKRKLQDAKDEAETVKSKASELYYHSDNGRLEQALKERLYNINYSYLPSGLEELQNWTVEARMICTQAEAAYSEIQRKRDQRNKNVQIPDGLLGRKAFNGDDDKAYEFMQKVASLPTNRLDSHIVCSCGRARVRSHLIEVSGDPDFFMGADPNAIVFYVAEVHFSRGSQSGSIHDIQDTVASIRSSSGSLGSLGEALKKAGLS